MIILTCTLQCSFRYYVKFIVSALLSKGQQNLWKCSPALANAHSHVCCRHQSRTTSFVPILNVTAALSPQKVSAHQSGMALFAGPRGLQESSYRPHVQNISMTSTTKVRLALGTLKKLVPLKVIFLKVRHATGVVHVHRRLGYDSTLFCTEGSTYNCNCNMQPCCIFIFNSQIRDYVIWSLLRLSSMSRAGVSAMWQQWNVGAGHTQQQDLGQL